MTEAEWLACTDPAAMLEYVRGKARDRQLRLFAVACSRHIWELLVDKRSQDAVDAIEKMGNSHMSQQNLPLYKQAAWDAYSDINSRKSQSRFERAALAICFTFLDGTYPNWQQAGLVSESAAKAVACSYGTLADERAAQTVLLRDVFGNPFRSMAIDRVWQTWNDSLVVHLAQSAYDERHLPAGTLDNGRLAILADALEEASCTNADILDHLRGPGPHVRGCWPVDLCLGKS